MPSHDSGGRLPHPPPPDFVLTPTERVMAAERRRKSGRAEAEAHFRNAAVISAVVNTNSMEGGRAEGQ